MLSAGLFGTIISAIAIPVDDLVTLVALLAIYGLARLALVPSSEPRREQAVGLRFLWFIGVPVFATYVLFATSPWLPAERIHFASGREVIAYVLEQDAGWTTLMTDKTRTIERVRSRQIGKRQICEIKTTLFGIPNVSIVALARGESPDYRPCRR